MKKFSTHKSIFVYLFLGLWLLFGLVQAFYTELLHDEAYYWMYAQNLDWGYFDHPPMIALLIKVGYALFQNELGVRLLIVFLSTLSIYFLEKLTLRKDVLLFVLIVCSVSIIQLGSIIAVPDLPLLFFSILFFFFLRKYLSRDNTVNAIALSITIALMLYSKYHGFLVLILTLIAVPQLFKRRSFYLITGITLLLYGPHIYWQIINGYPSYHFHVLERSQSSYNYLHTLEYLGGQLAVAGPLIGFILLYAAFRAKPASRFERVLQFNLFGFLGFFLLATLNDRVEANWTAPAIVPLVLLSHKYITDKVKLLQWTKRLAFVSIPLFIGARVFMMYDFLPEQYHSKTEFHGWKNWAEEVRQQAKERPVIFMNSYQKASKYTFYAGRTGFSINNVYYRRNQYDLWNIDEQIEGKEVMLIPNWYVPDLDSFKTCIGETYTYTFVDSFKSFTKISVDVPETEIKLVPGEETEMEVIINNLSHKRFNIDPDQTFPFLEYHLMKEEEWISHEKAKINVPGLGQQEKLFTKIKIKAPPEAGIYYLRLSVEAGRFLSFINSRIVTVIVE